MKTPEEIYKSIRKPLPPPGKTHRDKTKYNRKAKHKHKDQDWTRGTRTTGPD